MMKRKLKSKIESIIKSKKINVFLLFLTLSFMILVLTKLSKNYTNTITFNINKVNVPEEQVVLSDSNQQLSITLKTYGFKLLKYYFKQPSIDIDFSNDVNKNDTVYEWNKSIGYSKLYSQFDKSIEIVNIHPSAISFRYDVNAIKMVPVKLNVNIKFKSGYDLIGAYILQPDSIRIIGPYMLVSEIDVIETDTIIFDQIKSDILKTVSLKLPNKNDDIKFSNDKLLVKGTVVKYTEGVLSIPVIVKNVPDSIKIKYFPKVIDVSYYTSLIDFNSIKAKDFKIECDFKTITNDNSFLAPELIQQPEGVKNVRIKQKRIEFIITE